MRFEECMRRTLRGKEGCKTGRDLEAQDLRRTGSRRFSERRRFAMVPLVLLRAGLGVP